MKKLIITLVVCCLTGGVFMLAGSGAAKAKEAPKNTATLEVTEEALPPFSAVDIEADASDITLTTGDGYALKAQADKLTFAVQGNTLKVKQKIKKGKFPFLKGNNKHERKIQITVPADFNCRDLDLETGAGDITIALPSCREVNIETGAGDINIKGDNFADVDVEVGAGDITLQAALNGESDFKTGAGDINLNINANAQDFYTTAMAGAGKITVNGQHFGKNYRQGNPHLNDEVEAKTGAGDINISFNK